MPESRQQRRQRSVHHQLYSPTNLVSTHVYNQLEEKITSFQSDLARTKQELDNQQSERTKIAYVYFLHLQQRCFDPA